MIASGTTNVKKEITFFNVNLFFTLLVLSGVCGDSSFIVISVIGYQVSVFSRLFVSGQFVSLINRQLIDLLPRTDNRKRITEYVLWYNFMS